MCFKKVSTYLWIYLLIFLAGQSAFASNVNEADLSNDINLSTVNDEIKNLKFQVKKEIASQAHIQSELKGDVAQLKSSNEVFLATLKQNVLKQDSQFAQLREYFQLNNIILFVFAFLLLVVLLILRGVNKKLTKGIEIRLGGLAETKGNKSPLNSGQGNQLLVRDEVDTSSSEGSGARGISAEDLHKILGRQLGLEEGALVQTPPAKQDELLANEIHSVIKKRMMGFMRPTQPPKL
ncbi:hypothetical protein [Polynucleobacter sphagniphilus]|uniref:hypothetical protein n=1 Tax=Polynucleobacter sphagniphilus TaxID=1743169 RepID=UPI00247430A5|nr:hypothetical protein [Polynucleobacter sphagniphilus]